MSCSAGVQSLEQSADIPLQDRKSCHCVRGGVGLCGGSCGEALAPAVVMEVELLSRWMKALGMGSGLSTIKLIQIIFQVQIICRMGGL